jgi:tetratricopeptide (TPR) repeat protein
MPDAGSLMPDAGCLLPVAYCLFLLVIAGDPLAAWYANWGALLQSREELSGYREYARARLDCDALAREGNWKFNVWLSCAAEPDAAGLDAVRREPASGEAEAWLARAIARAPGNATARERLGALALSRGDYAAGLAHLQAAYAAGSRSRATRLLLADALVANGRVEEAVAVASGVEEADEYLACLARDRYAPAREWTRAAQSYDAAFMLEPGRADWHEAAGYMWSRTRPVAP